MQRLTLSTRAARSLRRNHRPSLADGNYHHPHHHAASELHHLTNRPKANTWSIQNVPVRQVRLLSVESPSNERGWTEEIRCLLDENFPRKAQDILEQQTSISTDTRELAGQILDSWIKHQNWLLDSYDSTNPDRSELKQIFDAAEQAHLLLERMIPSLAPSRSVLVTAPQSSDLSSGDPLSDEKKIGQRRHSQNFDVAATARCDAVLQAWARVARASQQVPKTRITRGIPQRAQFLLEQMEQSFAIQAVTETTVRPSVESYNRVIEAWAFSNEHLRGSMAEAVFQKLSTRPISGSRPNGESCRLIIWAWALSGERRDAFTATGHLMKMLRKLNNGDEDMEPSLEDYRITLKAWTTAEDNASPGKAMSVLNLMDYAVEKGTTQVQPDYDCFRYLLVTASKRPLLTDLGLLVDNVLKRMTARVMVPDTECYGAAIQVWKNAALNPEIIEYRDHSVKRALELLAEMRVAHNKSSSVSVEPTTEIINNVLEALSVSTNPRRTEQAEQLLLEMEEALEGNLTGAVPNAESYSRVMNVWRNCNTSAEKVPRAKAVLWRMQEKYDQLSTASDGPNEFVAAFNAFISVCASTTVKTEDRGNEVLREALGAFESIRTFDGLKPNAETYATLMEACFKHIAPGRERQTAVEKVFRLCCDDGMVDENVIRQLRSFATPEQFSKLVVFVSEEIDGTGTKFVPEAWTVNALGGRVVTADGRRTKPLSIDGKLTITRAMRDFQMRRMRDKRNRNLLRGGRIHNNRKRSTADV